MEVCDVLDCDIYDAVKAIKGRWNCVVVISLNEKQKGFSQLQNEFSYLTATQLTRTLSALKEHNLIIKEDKDYCLTTKGKELVPIIEALEAWSERN